jgi:hypothetical protein
MTATNIGMRVAEATAFLTTLVGDADTGHIVVWTLQDGRSRFFDLAEHGSIPKAAAIGVGLSADHDVYFSVCPTAQALSERQRGTGAQAKVVPAIWIELDVKPGAFASLDAALAFVRSCPIAPSLIVCSGGGIHVYWLLKEPLILESPAENQEVASILRRWQLKLKRDAARIGVGIDSTADLARVLRPVGTYNHKTGAPRLVELIHDDAGARYTIADIEDLLPDDLPRDDEAPAAPEEGKRKLSEQQIAAIAAAVGSYWIDSKRHTLALLLAGWMATNEVSEASARDVVRRCSHLAGDRNPEAKQNNVRDTYTKLRAGVRPVGWKGLTEELPKETLQALHDVLAVKLTAGGVNSNGHKKHDPGGSAPTEPIYEAPRISAQDQNIPEVSAAAWQALQRANSNAWLVSFGDVLARIGTDVDGTPRLREVTEDVLNHELARAAYWWRTVKDPQSGVSVEKHARVPPAIAKDMLAARNYPVPPLSRFVRIPVFARDGSLHDRPGYDPQTRSYYAPQPGVQIPPVPVSPTAADLKRAKSLIFDELLGDFPFAGDAERANALSMLIETAVRDLIDGPTPLRLIEAPTAGSGKGLLVDALVMPAIGRTVSVMPAADDDDEWRKKITSQLLKSPPAILIDNVTKPIDSGSLAAALTTTTYSDRQLGGNKMIDLPVRCLWLMTANNPTMSTEIARRTVRIRLDPKVDRPWERTNFRHENLREWVLANRGDLIWATLVLVRHWFDEGAEPGTKRLGSYESWSGVIGGILASAGVDGFLTNLADFYEVSDLEGAIWRQFVAAWFEKFGENETGVAELFAIAETVDGFDFGRGSERAQKTVFGIALNKQRDRVIGDYRIVQTRVVQRAKRWRLLRTSGNPFEALYRDDQRTGNATDDVNLVNVSEPFTESPRENTATNSVHEPSEVRLGSPGSHDFTDDDGFDDVPF